MAEHQRRSRLRSSCALLAVIGTLPRGAGAAHFGEHDHYAVSQGLGRIVCPTAKHAGDAVGGESKDDGARALFFLVVGGSRKRYHGNQDSWLGFDRRAANRDSGDALYRWLAG